MSENNVLGEKPCEHGTDHVKPVQSMAICARGIKYCMTLIEAGEMDEKECELCTIQWLCGEPIETCMNPEDSPQWHVECVQPSSMWVSSIEWVLNNPHTSRHVNWHEIYSEMINSMLIFMKNNGLSVKVVETSKK